MDHHPSTTTPAAVPMDVDDNDSSPPPPPPQQHMTFSNLRKLLQQLVQNREMYESYVDRSFRVQLVKTAPHMHFNTEKNKDYRKGQPKGSSGSNNNNNKYEFVIHATFSSPGETPGGSLLACKFPSSLIEPFFSKSPVRTYVCMNGCV
jgi:hypothetical protein